MIFSGSGHGILSMPWAITFRPHFRRSFPHLHHVVINSEAQKQLALRTGIAATVIPNVLDFAHPPKVDKAGGQLFRQAMGLTLEDKIILQPTRVIQRKGIEHAIELVRALDDACFKLVITHEAGDEGYAYAEWLESHARDNDVDLRLAPVALEDPWADPGAGQAARKTTEKNGYTLWDIYDQADLVTYPSLYEGFGNAFLEAVLLKKPILINRYETFVRDIEPLGFKLAIMDGFLSKSTVQQVKNMLASPAFARIWRHTIIQLRPTTFHSAYLKIGWDSLCGMPQAMPAMGSLSWNPTAIILSTWTEVLVFTAIHSMVGGTGGVSPLSKLSVSNFRVVFM